MEFTVVASGKKPFRYRLGDAACGRSAMVPCRPGKPCHGSLRAGGCRLLGAVSPVLDYFSGIASSEAVSVLFRDEGSRTVFKETGQRAAMVLLVHGMLHSACPFFNRFSALFFHYRVNITYEMFMHVVLTATLLGHRDAEAGNREASPARAEMVKLGQEIETRLRPLLVEARRRCDKDAAVNAVTIMFHLNTLAVEGLGDYQRTIMAQLRPAFPPLRTATCQ